MKGKRTKLTEETHRTLRPYARRVQRRHRLRRLCVCACVGVGAGLALLAVSFLVPIPWAPAWAGALAAAVCLVCGVVACVLRRPPAQVAAEIDGCGFQERVQTMLALEGDDSAFAALQRADTVRALRAADPKTSVPVRPPKKPLVLIAAGLVAGLLLGFAPNPQRGAVEEQETLRQAMQEQAQRVEAMADKLDKATGLDSARKAELNEQLRELAKQLRDGQNYKEGVKQASAMQQALGQAQQEIMQQQLDTMRDAFEQVPDLQEMADALQDAKAPAQAAEIIRNAAVQVLQSQDAGAARDLAKALRDAAGKVGDKAVSQALQDLADALEAGDADAAEAAMQALEEAMEAAGQSEDLQALEEQLQYVKSRLGQMAGEGTGEGQDGAQQGGQGQGGDGSGQGDGQGQGQGQGSGSGSGQGSGSGAGAGSGDVVESEKIYDDSRVGGGGQQVSLQGDKQDGAPGQQAEVDTGTGNLDGYVPYQQVVGTYAQDAIRAAQRAQLPPAVQDWIEEYFAALQQGG